MHLECRVVMRCDGAGTCAARDEPVTFTLDPMGAAEGGGTRYLISWRDTSAEAVSRDGRSFTFSEGAGDVQTLLAGNGTGLVWHRLTEGAAPSATVDFLDCEAPR
ncbi:hypothetical protein [Oceaniglobus roseus]|uniref:hypothetical protein n=1 Tax=Oceaniglobus roseus TaxID=1737570 RepID=UPI0012FFDBE5|nr:hypothetical protein [Kandeliimicrobium roseum]